MSLDIAANRRARKYTARELVLRVLWAFAQPFFRYSPRLLYGWRNMLLRLFGAHIGRQVQIHPRARIIFPWQLRVGDYSAIAEDVLIYNLGAVTLGNRVTISHRAQVCAGSHDYRHPELPLLKPPVRIEDGAWICTQAFVGPGVTIGQFAVVGACAVAIHDVDAWTVCAGNPAQKIGMRSLDTKTGS